MIKRDDRYNNKTKPFSKTASELHAGAEALEVEQEAIIGGASIDQLYQEALVSYVEAKLAQVSVIEDKLELLVDKQTASLQQLRNSTPGILALPSTRKAWQNAQSSQRARLQQLTGRLNAVRDIKDEMGLHSPKIEELATRKLRIENPELASDWDFMRETERVRQATLRERERKVQSKSQSISFGLSHKNSPR